MSIWLSQGFNAVSLGSILLLIAIGLTFSFGLMNVINMAHGELIMVGAYVAYVCQRQMDTLLGSSGLDVYLFVSLPVAFVVAAAMGALLERVLIRRLYGRPTDTLLATWGVSLVLQQLARSLFGASNVQVAAPEWLRGCLEVTPDFVMPYSRLFILALAGLCMLGVFLYLMKSSQGRRVRAVMQNREIAGAMGVSTPWVDTTTFALSSGLAGVAGCALSLLGPIGRRSAPTTSSTRSWSSCLAASACWSVPWAPRSPSAGSTRSSSTARPPRWPKSSSSSSS